eukprot:11071081-Lingulodinium_polyedra.AAC.1
MCIRDSPSTSRALVPGAASPWQGARRRARRAPPDHAPHLLQNSSAPACHRPWLGSAAACIRLPPAPGHR